MIRIKKPATPPSILKSKGIAARNVHCDDYSTTPTDYEKGRKSFEFKESIYNAKSVKNALMKAQHEKCCYCEWKLSPGSFGDVEHFRPKAGYKQIKGDPIGKPGYYWLAYEWSNLYISCQICNQAHKQNYFPLADPAQRARSHEVGVSSEQPLLIDPGEIDPSLYIALL